MFSGCSSENTSKDNNDCNDIFKNLFDNKNQTDDLYYYVADKKCYIKYKYNKYFYNTIRIDLNSYREIKNIDL